MSFGITELDYTHVLRNLYIKELFYYFIMWIMIRRGMWSEE